MITIITAVYNAKEQIEKTILSVLHQSYPNLEYIVIDGGSTDGTVDLIKKYSSRISYWVSEKDKGVFDAMNKGIRQSKGQWVNFMNAGDCFVDEQVISNIDFESYPASALIYGNTHYENVGIKKPFKTNSLEYGCIMACHQSMFFNRSLLKDELFYSSRFKLLCDYDLICRIINAQYPLTYINQPIASYRGGGLSASISWEARRARYYFIYKHFKLKGLTKSILESIGLMSLPNRIQS